MNGNYLQTVQHNSICLVSPLRKNMTRRKPLALLQYITAEGGKRGVWDAYVLPMTTLITRLH